LPPGDTATLDQDFRREVLVPTGYSIVMTRDRTFRFRARPPRVRKEDRPMLKVKSLGFRIVMVLSALASSALVLEAGQRWR
jgi:hypothetical protein